MIGFNRRPKPIIKTFTYPDSIRQALELINSSALGIRPKIVIYYRDMVSETRCESKLIEFDGNEVVFVVDNFSGLFYLEFSLIYKLEILEEVC